MSKVKINDNKKIETISIRFKILKNYEEYIDLRETVISRIFIRFFNNKFYIINLFNKSYAN